MLRRIAVLGVVVVFPWVLTACGGGSSGPVDTSQPLEGRELRRASELEGTWLALNEGAYLGLEFMDDGQVLATMYSEIFDEVAPALFNYSVLEGGRLALVGSAGQQIYTTKIDGEQLEIEGFLNTQRFMRLPRGQTLEQGAEELMRVKQAEYQQRYDVINEMLRQADVVIEPTTPSPNAPPAMALVLEPTGSGRAWYEADPPHLDAIDTQIGGPNRDNQPDVTVSFGRQLRPATTQGSGGGSITFAVSGDWREPTLLSQVNYGGQSFELALRRDRSRHAEIVGRFDAEMARIDAALAPITRMLGDFAILEGGLSTDSPTLPRGYRDRLALVRNPDTGMYTGTSVVTAVDNGVTNEFPSVDAEVRMVEDTPMLLVRTPVRQYQLAVEGDTLSGGWFPYGAQQGYAAAFVVQRSTDAATRQRENDAQRQALLALDGSVSYYGLVNHLPRFDRGAASLTRLTIAAQPDGTFQATARFPAMNGTETMTGTIVDTVEHGPMLDLRFADFNINGQSSGGNITLIYGLLRNQSWQLQVTGSEPGSRMLSGAGRGLMPPALEFREMSDAWRAELVRDATATLSAGADFTWQIPPDQGGATRLTLDAASRRVTGELSEATTGTWRGHIGSLYDGELTEIEGFPAITATHRAAPGARLPLDQSAVWFLLQTDGGLLLKGQTTDNRNGYSQQSELVLVGR